MSRAQFFSAADGRPIAMLVPHDFDDFESHPPTFETEEEREWLRRHYRVESPELERRTKAHLTADELPLQITVLARPAGAFVKPHWHVKTAAPADPAQPPGSAPPSRRLSERPPESETRHQAMICTSGSARIGLYAREGDHVADVVLGAGDLILMYEGHSIETLEDGTRLLELKQGPMPADPFADSIAIEVARAPA